MFTTGTLRLENVLEHLITISLSFLNEFRNPIRKLVFTFSLFRSVCQWYHRSLRSNCLWLYRVHIFRVCNAGSRWHRRVAFKRSSSVLINSFVVTGQANFVFKTMCNSRHTSHVHKIRTHSQAPRLRHLSDIPSVHVS